MGDVICLLVGGKKKKRRRDFKKQKLEKHGVGAKANHKRLRLRLIDVGMCIISC